MRKVATSLAFILASATTTLADAAADLARLHEGFAKTLRETHDISGLNGQWLFIRTDLLEDPDRARTEAVLQEELLTRCATEIGGGTMIDVISPLTFDFVRMQPKREQWSTRYEWVGGNTYARSFDFDKAMQFMYGDNAPHSDADPAEDPLLMDARLMLLRREAEPVDIFLPTPDVMVVSQRGIVNFLLRCPATQQDEPAVGTAPE